MSTINNKEKLIKNGGTPTERRARKIALESIEYALSSADPRHIIKSKLKLDDSTLKVNSHAFNLKRFKRIFVVGGGKASGTMAEALEKLLRSHITSGYVNVPHGSSHNTEIVKLHDASHPTPDEAGVEGTREMLKLAEQAEEDDLLICLISGGGSSLMPLPRNNISIADKRELTTLLLKSGATINEINTVRKHISDFKGGWLAKKAYPATILNLILSDVVGDPLDFIASGPTVPDSTTFSDAIRILKKYGLWDKTSESIKTTLSEGEKGRIPETPKAGDEAFRKVHNVVVGNNRSAALATCDFLHSVGLNRLLLTSTMEGEARHIGVMLASIGHEILFSGKPVAKPCGVVAGGETTVTVAGKGKGGRNQELTIAAALKLHCVDGLVLASASTDGIDGPTDAAGAIADGKTLLRAQKLGLTPEDYLTNNDSYNFFQRLGDLIFTGPTGTNVNDISIIVAL